jgi:predicted enzyme related to lactoylglutathione lyase
MLSARRARVKAPHPLPQPDGSGTVSRRMSERDSYPAGVPCWVETLQPDPAAALDFYGPLLGWELGAPEPMPAGWDGDYYVARLGGRPVAGIGTHPDLGGPPAAIWNTYVCVDEVAQTLGRVEAAGGTVLMGPLPGHPAGRLAVLSDPTGAAVSVAEPDARPMAQVVNEPGAWTMSALHTGDGANATAFYEAIFDWQPDPVGPLTLLRLPGHVGGEPDQSMPRDLVAVMAPPDDAIPPHWNVNLLVADADAIARRAESLGGSVLMPPSDAGPFRSAALLDPQGAAFSISQPLGGPPA